MGAFSELVGVRNQRLREGRCPECGAHEGPDHLCPDLTPTKVSPRGSRYGDDEPDDGIAGVGFMDPRNRPDEPEPGAYLRPDEGR